MERSSRSRSPTIATVPLPPKPLRKGPPQVPSSDGGMRAGTKRPRETIGVAVVPPPTPAARKAAPKRPSQQATMAVPAVHADAESDPTVPAPRRGPASKNDTLAVPALSDEPRTEERQIRRPRMTILADGADVHAKRRAARGHTLRADALDEVDIDLEDSVGGIAPSALPRRTTARFTQPLSVVERPKASLWSFAASAVVLGLLLVAAINLGL